MKLRCLFNLHDWRINFNGRHDWGKAERTCQECGKHQKIVWHGDGWDNDYTWRNVKGERNQV